jgi:hypothetical protein
MHRFSVLGERRTRLTRRLKDEGEHSVKKLCSTPGVYRSTLFRSPGEDGRELGRKN